MEDQIDSSTDGLEIRIPSCGSCGVTRREALIMAASAAALTLLPILQARADSPDQWVSVGKVTDFTVGTPIRVTPAPTEVLFVTRVDDKNLVAVTAKCTHHGCEVAWTPADMQFECPCHGAAFTSTGKNVHGTRRHPEMALPPLLSLPTRQNKGTVEVDLAGIDVTMLEPTG